MGCNAKSIGDTKRNQGETGGKLLKKLFKDVSLPLIGERIVMGCGYVVFSALVAGLETLSVAAHSIALTIEQAFYVPGYGIQTAVSTLAGNAVEKKNELEFEKIVCTFRNYCGCFYYEQWHRFFLRSRSDYTFLYGRMSRLLCLECHY